MRQTLGSLIGFVVLVGCGTQSQAAAPAFPASPAASLAPTPSAHCDGTPVTFAEPTLCPAFEYGPRNRVTILVVRPTEFLLTDMEGFETVSIPRDDSARLREMLDALTFPGSVTLYVASDAGAGDDGIGCVLGAALEAGYSSSTARARGGNPFVRVEPCRLDERFHIDASGRLTPPAVAREPDAPLSSMRTVELAGSCVMPEIGACQEYPSTNRAIARVGLGAVQEGSVAAGEAAHWVSGLAPATASSACATVSRPSA